MQNNDHPHHAPAQSCQTEPLLMVSSSTHPREPTCHGDGGRTGEHGHQQQGHGDGGDGHERRGGVMRINAKE